MSESRPNPVVEPEWDGAAEGLPQESDQFIQKYLQGRSALIAQEKKQRTGSTVPRTHRR